MRTTAWSVLFLCVSMLLPPGALAGSISGRVGGAYNVFPLAGIRVLTHNVTRSCQGPETTTDTSGYHLFENLEAGTYHVRFFDPNNIYMGENYDDLPGDYYNTSAKDIVVTSSGAVSYINAALYPCPRIAGRVTKWDGTTPLTGIMVQVFELQMGGSSNNFCCSYAVSDTNGNYLTAPIYPGTYAVGFVDSAGIYLPEMYDNFPCTIDETEGTAVTLIMNTTTIINAALDGPPSVVGLQPAGADRFNILFIGPPGRNHVLQEAATLTNGWGDVGSPVVSVTGTNILSRTSTSPCTFWRVRLVR